MGCKTCHGRVDRMPLMMQKSSLQMEWNLDCHRDPSRFVRRSCRFAADTARPDTSQ